MSESYDDSNRTPQCSTGYIHMRLTVCSLSPRSCAQVREGCPLEQLPPTHTHPHTLPITDSTTHCLLTAAGLHRRECALPLNKPKHTHTHTHTRTQAYASSLCAQTWTPRASMRCVRACSTPSATRSHAHTRTRPLTRTLCAAGRRAPLLPGRRGSPACVRYLRKCGKAPVRTPPLEPRPTRPRQRCSTVAHRPTPCLRRMGEISERLLQ